MFEYSTLIDIDKEIASISASDSPADAARALVAGFAPQDAQLALNSILRRASGSRNVKVVKAALDAGAKAGAFFSQAVVNAGVNVDILRELHVHGANISLSRAFPKPKLVEMKREFTLENKVAQLKL